MKKAQEVDKILKEEAKRALYNPEAAQEFKEKGNKLFKEGRSVVTFAELID